MLLLTGEEELPLNIEHSAVSVNRRSAISAAAFQRRLRHKSRSARTGSIRPAKLPGPGQSVNDQNTGHQGDQRIHKGLRMGDRSSQREPLIDWLKNIKYIKADQPPRSKLRRMNARPAYAGFKIRTRKSNGTVYAATDGI